MITDQDIFNEFTTECNEHLSTVEDDLLQLETTESVANSETVANLFRVMHSIKGGAGMLGLHAISSLAHDLESVLSLIRDRQLAPEPDVVDVLLSGSDQLKVMLKSPELISEEGTEATRLRLRKFLDPSASESPEFHPDAGESCQAELDALKAETDAAEVADSADATLEYDKVYELTYELMGETEAEIDAARGLIESQLIREGTILENSDHTDDGERSGPRRCVVRFKTWMERDFICAIVGLPECQIEDVTPSFSQNTEKPMQTQTPVEIEDQVTVQDTSHAFAPVIDERQIVSNEDHETAPDTLARGAAEATETVRINVAIIDTLMNLAGELVSLRNQFTRNVQKNDPTMRAISHGLDTVTSSLQETIMSARMQPMAKGFGRLPRMVREISRKLGKQIELEVVGNEVEIDKTILEALVDPLTHLIRNCCDHGIESPDERQNSGKSPSGQISLRAYHEGGQINIEIRDDGAGIDVDAVKAKALENGLKTAAELDRLSEQETYGLLFQSGFSTASIVSEVSGRGVGLDVVMTSLASVGGEIDVQSSRGAGTSFLLRLPLTLAIMPCVIVEVLGDRFAIPQINVEELVCLYGTGMQKNIEFSVNREVFHLRGRLIQLARLGDILSRSEPFTPEWRAELTELHRQTYAEGNPASPREVDAESRRAEQAEHQLNIVVLRIGNSLFGLAVDRILGNEEIVVKPMHSSLKHLACYSGATVMGDGQAVLILDAHGMARHVGLDLIDNDNFEEQQDVLDTSDSNLYLLFDNNTEQQYAADIKSVKRIVRLEAEDVFRSYDEYLVQLEGTVIQAIPLDRKQIEDKLANQELLYLLLPNDEEQAAGLLVGRLVDITKLDTEITETENRENSMVGAAMVKDRMTLFIDLFAMLDKRNSQDSLATWSAWNPVESVAEGEIRQPEFESRVFPEMGESRRVSRPETSGSGRIR